MEEARGNEAAAQAGGWLESAEKISRILSVAAIPVVLGIGGLIIQRQLQKQTVGAAYVNLAVTILENPDRSKVPGELREWAVDLLNDNSPTKLNSKAADSLKSGAVTLPTSFNFVPSPALTEDLKQKIGSSLKNFGEYLAALGWSGDTGEVSVEIAPGAVVERNGQSGVALWDPSTRTVTVASAFENDDAAILRQFAHLLLTKDLPADSPNYWAIESGLATYFACSFTGDPVMGDKATEAGKQVFPPQDLRQERKFSKIDPADWASVQNDGSQIWGGVFWQIRDLLKQPRADSTIAVAWRDLLARKPANDAAYQSMGSIIVNRLNSIDAQYGALLKANLERRGLRLTNPQAP
jgi:hypothetical protein